MNPGRAFSLQRHQHVAPLRLREGGSGSLLGRARQVFRRIPGSMAHVSLLAITLAAVVAAAYADRLQDALVVIVSLLAIPLLVKRPLILVAVYLLVSTNLLETLPLRTLAVARLGPGFTLRGMDVIIMAMLAVSLVRLGQHRQRPMFLGFVILWIAYVVFRLVYGFVLGETGLDLATNMAQAQVGWVLYLLIVTMIDSPRDLRAFVWLFLAIMAAAVLFQVAEYAHGSRIVPFGILASRFNYYTSTFVLSYGNTSVPYLWSRALEVTVIGLFLALSSALGSRRFLPYAILAAAGLLSIAMTQIRAVYFGVSVGVLAFFVLRRWTARSSARLVIFVVVLIAVLAVLTPLIAASFGGNPLQTWVARASTVVNFGQQTNWQIRAADARRSWEVIKEAPALGYGWGETYLRVRGESGIDVLLVHGFIGTAMILGMYLTVLISALRLGRRLQPSLERSWLLGLVGALIAFLAMSPTQDVLTSGGFAVVAAVFVDRISAFHEKGLIGEAPILEPNRAGS
jgi:O-Antigen ligase